MKTAIRVKEGDKWTKVNRYEHGNDGAVIYQIGQFQGVARRGSWMPEEEYKAKK